MKLRAVIFDCFGVIYPDTLALVGRKYVTLDDPRREDLRYLRRQTDLGQLSRDAFWDGAAQIFGISRRELDRELDEVRMADWDLLKFIKSLRPQLKTALLSNVGEGFVERIFESEEPGDYFDAMVLSFKTGELKPAPGPYLEVARQLHVAPEECLMIDDSPANCSGAEAVDMSAIQYHDLEQFRRDFSRYV